MNFNLDRSLEILAHTPAVLDTLLRPLSDVWVFSNEGPETWSPFDILGHLIHGEAENWIHRVRVILEDGESHPFEPFKREAMFEESQGKSLGELLDTFKLLREKSLVDLAELNLTPAMLEKRGMHPALGVVTLSQLLSTWTAHDLTHLAQMARVMAKQYREAIGPWHEFMSIMTR